MKILYILVLVYGGSYGKAIDHVPGFQTVEDGTRAAAFAEQQMKFSFGSNAFCIRQVQP
ncbi:hypothetical protein [Pandoraea sp. 64-18]|mgnify:CR=1 FL=1|uniref:hypothetical protein n=1 Tax=Pandoraea sp. 64-18 TaxID=1895806 RepID=UPI000A3F65F6|nr:hypothetical protein [Pandoraea sp. 64-18]